MDGKRDDENAAPKPAADEINKFLIDDVPEATAASPAPGGGSASGTAPASGAASEMANAAASSAAAHVGAPLAAPAAAVMGAAPTDEELKAAIPDEPPAVSVADGGTPVEGSRLSRERLEQLTRHITAALKTVYDPEIPTDVYELGLIYKIDITDEYDVNIDMTLTAPGCPVAGEMPLWVEKAVSAVPGIEDVFVNLTFDPPWEMSLMSDEARVALNVF